MSCSVAVSNSPVFSPPPSLFRQNSAVKLPPSPVFSPSSSSSPSSSPLRRRLQKPTSPLPSSPLASSTSEFSPVLKRKRPARLHIPDVTVGFGGQFVGVYENVEMEREGDGYYVCCKKGRRDSMEDRFSSAVHVHGDSSLTVFGIFDGHGGSKAAEYAAENLDKNIVNEVMRRNDGEVEDAVRHGYLTTDAEFLKEDVRGGSCCVTALIRKGNLVVSNVGDCRAVMSNGGVAQALTSDHRLSREDEKARVETSGGYVDLVHGTLRVQGSLAVSRAFGDGHLKQWVIAEPETNVLRIKPEHEFLILASDGLWDKVGNQEAVDIARPLCTGADKQDRSDACKKLIDLSVSRGSTDDISVMLIEMKHYV
ncbi:Protein phosphatase 2C family protein [Euphorbia peplus]|nr:Protein phosphatase 2C family protein [Euphorbia peplus]